MTGIETASLFATAIGHHQAGRVALAEAGYREVLGRDPRHGGALQNLGVIALQMGRIDVAHRLLDLAAGVAPDDAILQSNLGLVLESLGRLGEAEAAFRHALRLKPDAAEAASNLGALLAGAGRFEDAAAVYRDCIAVRWDFAPNHAGLGAVLRALGRAADAERACRDALQLSPNAPDALCNLGGALADLDRLDEAEAAYRAALRLDPDHPGAHNGLGLLLLVMGRYLEGWAETEWRWRTPEMAGLAARFDQPRWQGEAAPGRTLLVRAEQGFGDLIQFCRYLPMVAARGLRVVLQVRAPMIALMRRLADGPADIVAHGAVLPPFDLHCPIASLPGALATTPDTVPPPAVLRGDPAGRARWADRLGRGNGLRVGLVWAGNPELASDRRRSIAPERLAVLAGVAGVTFYSLQQRGPGMALPTGLPLVDPMGGVADFTDTADIIDCLDLVISVDTSVAHLAATLGRPVWLLNRFDSDWRWPRGRDDTPWYPTVRQFRQPAPGDWDGVLAAVRAALIDLAGQNVRAPLTHR